ncbi:PSD1 and planctomycete cytochrome C domain-containing protein [Candidatus Laterigemmans baculatus]|uniref:PSD1 and planctomycete cytochrome C domain-containing protein n=1 Tax=Candidatus Laterigemmans baculatus TaxID=2770505 RepID=UPI0013DB66A5|nr:PSD1 and planctomycete cytochrome C domain-containing protein [Candidatus Laterigemmans baculatus]
MPRLTIQPFVIAPLVALAFGSIAAHAADPHPDKTDPLTDSEREFFEERIRPVLVNRCYDCHTHEGGAADAEYALDSRAGMRRGGVSGEAAIVPGDPDASLLLQALRYQGDLQMPPDEPLPDSVVADFEHWVSIGAPDPRNEDPEELRRIAQAKSAEQLWSFHEPVKSELPTVANPEWPRTDLDRFVLARLESEGLQPVPDADPRKLIRRVHFDLTGLPPSPETVEQFAAAPSTEAFTRIVDELLNSPQFGERWGRHWLDLARYAESSGMEFNFTYPHAWPYRNYVIDSFNDDKPYDQFIIEQIAGDLLPSSSPEERDEQRLATGFLAVGPKRHNAGTRDFLMDMVDDQIKTTTEAFLGLTVGCARCHDHKFDPIPDEDYYALAGIFMSTDTLYGTTKIQYSRHPSDTIPFGPNAEEQHAKFQAHQQELAKTEKALTAKQEKLKKLKAAEKKAAPENKGDANKDNENKNDEKKDAAKQEEAAEDAAAELKTLEKEVAALNAKLKKLRAEAPKPPQYAMGARDGKPIDTHVAIGGDPGEKGEQVPRGFLKAFTVEGASEIPNEASGRLELARWIASPHNPLTARVMVNRVWHHLFGRGLVPTVNNFGVLGEAPSHPQLLDHLAVEFMEHGWSVKRLIRSLVLSRTYQLSTQKAADNFRHDPQNRLLWRMTPRRLEVEPLRDAMLAVSGQLDAARPEGSPVTALGQQLARGVSYEKLNPANTHRTVYQPVVRHYTSYMLQEFDFAASSLVVGDRAETTTAQQALFFLNNEFALEQSEATARLLMEAEPEQTDARIRLAYQRILSRPPSPDELAAVREYLQGTSALLTEQYPEEDRRQTVALASFVQTLFGSAEFRYLIHSPTNARSDALAAAPR